MSKSDLKTRPIFHYDHDAIKAHVLLCFMALMMGKFLEIKTGLSIQRVRDIIFSVHEAHIEDTLTGTLTPSNFSVFSLSSTSSMKLDFPSGDFLTNLARFPGSFRATSIMAFVFWLDSVKKHDFLAFLIIHDDIFLS